MSVNSTPRKINEQADISNLESVRDHLVEEVGHIQVYQPSQFLGTVLPEVTDKELAQIKGKLKIPRLSQDWIKAVMGGAKPCNTGKKLEHAVFVNIANTFNKVAGAVEALGIGNPLVMGKDDPHRSPKGGADYNTRPDGCILLRKTQLPIDCLPDVDRLQFREPREPPTDISWVDVAGTAEYKKEMTDRNWRDNARKAIYSMCQVMAYDPCRKATFAFTYEDTRVRFWWCDRSGFMASEAIDYFENIGNPLSNLGLRLHASSQQILSGLNSRGPVNRLTVHLKQVFLRKAVNRIHYRILVNEVCERIDEMTSFHLVLRCLMGATVALQALQNMGLVHRDVSTGNILFHRQEGIGKLGDLETCMEYLRESPDKHEDLTGTPYFMSDEVMSGKYSWRPKDNQQDLGVLEEFDISMLTKAAKDIPGVNDDDPFIEAPAGALKRTNYGFVQNYIHDAESIWWILCWFLLATRPSELPIPVPAIEQGRAKKLQEFFPGPDLLSKRKAPSSNPFLESDLHEHPDLPESYRGVYDFVCGRLRSLLTNIYTSAESLSDRFMTEDMNGIHDKTLTYLVHAVKLGETIDGIRFAEYVRLPPAVQLPNVSAVE